MKAPSEAKANQRKKT